VRSRRKIAYLSASLGRRRKGRKEGRGKGKKKTCSGRMAGKEKENMKRKGKQRLVGEMAIRWIAIVHFL
jgi:hypothetical protein